MTPTADELAQIRARSTERQFTEWSDDQRAASLAVFRNHTDPAAVAAYLNWSVEKTTAVLDSMYGWLLWDRANPTPTSASGLEGWEVSDDLLRRFRSAFPTEPLPPRPVTGHRCPECDDTDRLLGGRTWPEVAADFPVYCHDVFPLLTDEARRYYLPAFMLSALGPDDGMQGTSVEAALTDGRLPADRFTAGQRDAIVAWLDEYTGGTANWMGPEWFRPTPTD